MLTPPYPLQHEKSRAPFVFCNWLRWRGIFVISWRVLTCLGLYAATRPMMMAGVPAIDPHCGQPAPDICGMGFATNLRFTEAFAILSPPPPPPSPQMLWAPSRSWRGPALCRPTCPLCRTSSAATRRRMDKPNTARAAKLPIRSRPQPTRACCAEPHGPRPIIRHPPFLRGRNPD